MPASILDTAMLEQHGFARRALLVDGQERTVCSREFDPSDDFALDVLSSVSGRFLDEGHVQDARLVVFLDEVAADVVCRLEDAGPELSGIERRYRLPEEEAAAVRLIADLIGEDLPAAVVCIGDEYGVRDGCLVVNGRTAEIAYPSVERIESIGEGARGVPQLRYLARDSNYYEISVEDVVGRWR